MQLKYLTIKNFRNFKHANIKLSNQNVIFGMNDVGKTNLLYALRFLMDRQIRQYGFKESDFHQKNTNENIEITLELDITDKEINKDTQLLISKVVGSRTQSNLDTFYIKAIGKYNEKEYLGNSEIFWGSDLDALIEIPQKGLISDLDKLFKIVYIDATINLDTTFSKHRKNLFDESKLNDEDVALSTKIQQKSNEVNEKIGEMNVIQEFQETLTDEYKSLRDENIKIEMKSEMAIKGYFSDLTPYIKRDDDEEHYPTSGDGRKKLLAYSLLNHVTKELNDDKIVIFLIEEPENSLHRSMQIALSKQLFEQKVYNYFFLSTHSPELLYEMDDASLIRLYSEENVMSKSHIYHVDDEYKNMKKELNRSLATALFANKVLLIEGESERVLFEKILEETYPTYELDGGYILSVDGVKFKPYFDVLNALNITTIVKTDNDLKAKNNQISHFDLIGLNRGLELIGEKKKDFIVIDYSTVDENNKTVWMIADKKRKVSEEKQKIYKDEHETIKLLKENNIFLSEIDLEHDLYNVLGDRINNILDNENPVNYLQQAKMINMIELTKGLSDKDCKTIIEHDLFAALKRLVD